MKKRRTRKEDRACKLTLEQQQLVLQQIAGHRSYGAIVRWAKEFLGTNLHITAIKYYKQHPRFEADRERYRLEFEAGLAKEQYASKRRRIAEASEHYEFLRDNWNKLSRDQRDAKMTLISALEKIDTMVVGRNKGETTVNIQYNKFSNMPTPQLIQEAGRLTRYLTDAKPESQTTEVYESGAGPKTSRKENENGDE